MRNEKYAAFITAARLGSFKKTAEELGYTQAGISYMLNALEEEMGIRLFNRDYGGVQLTSEAKQLLPFVQDVSNSEYRMNVKINELKSLDSGTLRIAAFSSIAIHWLPGILEEFLHEHPNIDVDLRCCEDPQELEQIIRRGDVDCGFCVQPIKCSLDVIPLKRDPMLVILPQDHPLAHVPKFPMKALSEYPYIRLDSGTANEIDDLFAKYNITPNVYMSMEQDYAVMAMVSKGFGFSIFPKLMLQDIPFPVVRRELEIPAEREIAIASRSYETASAAARKFLGCVQRWTGQLDDN